MQIIVNVLRRLADPQKVMGGQGENDRQKWDCNHQTYETNTILAKNTVKIIGSYTKNNQQPWEQQVGFC